MKLTKKQYDKAVEVLPELRKAEETIKAWTDALKALGPVVEHVDVLEIETDDMSFRSKSKEGKETKNAPALRSA